MLYGSNISPYVRKVPIQALEGGYWDQIDFFEMATAPTNPNMDNVNPLKKVPALETDDGQVLFDSRVVCEYLDQALGGAGRFRRTATSVGRRSGYRRLATAFWMRHCWRVMSIPCGPNWPVGATGTMDR